MDNTTEGTSSFSTESSSYPLPEGTMILNHQVAGHVHGKSKTKLGMLKHRNGYILKPVLDDKRGKCEQDFYETIFSADCSDPYKLALRKFLPMYQGTWETNIDGKRVKYICLEDIMDRFSKPSVLDVKIGPQTYDPEATPEKIKLESAKYPAGKIIGFRILGMRLYKGSANGYVVYGYDFGKKQTPDSILNALGSFFDSVSRRYQKQIINGFLNKLKSVHQWFVKQRTYTFYSSSLLFAYESDESKWQQSQDINAKGILQKEVDAFLRNAPHEPSTPAEMSLGNGTSGESDNTKVSLNEVFLTKDYLWDLKMIDFCHVYPSSNIDSNYIFGLERLIKYLEELLVQVI